MKRAAPWTARVLSIAFLAFGWMALDLFAQQEPTSLQDALGDSELGGQWIYDDIEQGIALAKETGTPLLVLFR